MKLSSSPARAYSVNCLLKDGGSIHVRAIRPDDKERLLEHFRGLSATSVYQRFLGPKRTLSPEELVRLTEVDFVEAVALVATLRLEDRERIIGVGRYIVTDRAKGRAEVAFAVLDEHQGRGIGTLLLEHLAAIARKNGLERFEADTLQTNTQMLEVFGESGFANAREGEGGVVHVVFPIDETERVADRSADREQKAAAESLRAILRPRSLAIAGVSRADRSIGRRILANLVQGGFRGPIYPIHPSAPEIAGLRAYPRLVDVKAPIDLAVVCVPAEHAKSVVADAAQAGVRGLVVISAGFAETSPEGRRAETEIRELVRRSGMRMVGPNCMGVLDTDPEVRLNATFAPIAPIAGNVGMLSQSGAVGLALLDWARTYRIGLSSFVSAGNKADISGNDLLSFWMDDPRTRVIALYLESFGNPRKFARLAPRVALKKPIVALKSGRSSAGMRAAQSHTAALASADSAVDALFAQSGVIRAETMEEMLETVDLFSSAPIPKGKRIAAVTNAGGPGILFADACEARGLEIPEISDAAKAALRSFLPAHASVSNPIDLLASASPADYAKALEIAGNLPDIDVVAAIYVPPYETSVVKMAQAIAEGAGRVPKDKPVVAVFIASEGAPQEIDRGPRGKLPVYAFPENAARALAAAGRYAEWRGRPRGRPFALDAVGVARVRASIDGAKARLSASGWVEFEDAAAIVSSAGIRIARYAVSPVERAGEAAERLGFPIVAKGLVEGVLHKSDLGLVAVGLDSKARAAAAVRDMADRMARLNKTLDRVLLQEKIEGGIEMIAGVTSDPLFGPLVVAGAGGVEAELARDAALRLTPMTELDAHEMIDGLRMKRRFEAFRGAPARDRRAFEEVLLALSGLVEAAPEIAELDLNPVIVLPEGRGAIVADVRLRLTRS